MLGDLPGDVLVLLIAVLPGGIYTLAFERQAGAFGVAFADRMLRFIASSVGLHLLLAWPEYALYRAIRPISGSLLAGQFALLWLWLLIVVVFPYTVGTILGGLYQTRGTRHGWRVVRRWLSLAGEQRLLRWALGRDPTPRAWDYLFSEQPSCYIRIKTVTGHTLAGRFATRSYAGGFPHVTDLLLEEAYSLKEDGRIDQPQGYPIYVPAEQIGWLEIVPPKDTGRAPHGNAAHPPLVRKARRLQRWHKG